MESITPEKLDKKPETSSSMDPRLKLSYDNFQSWIRHYQSLSVNINVFSLTAYAAVLGLTVQKMQEPGAVFHPVVLLPLVFPLMLSFAAIAVTYWLSETVKLVFEWLVRIERGLGMYAPHPALDDNLSILDPSLPAKGQETQPIFKLFFAMQAFAISASAVVAVFAFIRS